MPTSAIVRRGGGALIRRAVTAHPYYRYGQRALQVYRAARMVTPVARRTLKFARAVRAKRKGRRTSNRARKSVLRRRVGEPLGTSNAKHETNQYVQNLSTKTLYQFRLLDLPEKTTLANENSQLDRRVRDCVNMRGIKFCMNIRRLALGAENDNKSKLWFNFAIISPKAGIDNAETIPLADFFRSDGNTREVDFNAAANTALDWRCNPINTDKYNVHKHKRLQLAPMDSTIGNKERLIEWYMPLKRQIRYQAGSVFPEGKNMYLVMWHVISSELVAFGAQADSVDLRLKHIKYFKETYSF